MKSLMTVAVLVGFFSMATFTARVECQEKKDEKAAVRMLKFTPKDPTVAITLGGQSKITVLGDVESVEKLVGKASAKGLIDLVDFGREKIVFVSWTTSGPPDGALKYETKGAGNERKLTFFVQGPPGAKIRGQRARLGADFFAVPRDVNVAFDSKERP